LGFSAALSAYVIWGLFPLYYHQLSAVPAVEVLCHRILWSAVLCLALLAARGKLGELRSAISHRRTLLGLLASGLCISVNWGSFIWTVSVGRALDSSLAYYVTPLVMLMLGVVFLRERLSPRQCAALLVMVVAVALLTADRGALPWVVVVLPISFGLYGRVRKLVAVDARIGVTVETLLLTPLALAYLLSRPAGGALFQGTLDIKLLLLACGPVTTLPLVLFAIGARNLPLTTVGLLQYVNPTMQALMAVILLQEPLSRMQTAAFALIWVGLAIYSLPIRGAERAG
jgi:chloramphenicol-sensitive protein RarD